MQKNKHLRVIIDTNLWISFLISPKKSRLDELLFGGKVKLLFSSELFDEIAITITKPKLKKYFGANAMPQMLSSIEPFIDFVDVKSLALGCRDSKDNFLLSLAIDGKADFLLTGDKDLLEIKTIGVTKILTISQFFQLIEP
jgi:putative PIN family toxin of toxin-antitoxin system